MAFSFFITPYSFNDSIDLEYSITLYNAFNNLSLFKGDKLLNSSSKVHDLELIVI